MPPTHCPLAEHRHKQELPCRTAFIGIAGKQEDMAVARGGSSTRNWGGGGDYGRRGTFVGAGSGAKRQRPTAAAVL